jgi:hypothetical protein
MVRGAKWVVLLNKTHELMRVILRNTSKKLFFHHLYNIIIEDANNYDKKIHVCYIDLVKAYDRIEKWTIEEILENLGFPTNLKNLIVDINSGVKVKVETDYEKIEEVEVRRGLRQGCPLSPLLFSLYVEPLIRWIYKEHKRYVFEKNKELYLLLLVYMDDIVIITNTREKMEEIMRKIERYSNTYGLKISEKLVYSMKESKTCSEKEENEKETDPIEIQEIKIKTIKPRKVYKYLEIWTNLINTWKKQKKEAKKKYTNTTNLLGRSVVDMRIQSKVINIVVNIPLEYGFYSIPYNKKELEEIDIKNKKTLKK